MSPSADRVVLLLHGGLGNQLFQYAAALDLARDQNPARVLVLSYGNEWGGGHPDLSTMAGIPIRYPHRGHRSLIPGIAARESWKDSASSLIARAWGALSYARLVQQSDPFAKRDVPSGRTIILDGFFQHPSWWEGSWDRVAELINARRPSGVDELRSRHRAAIKLRRSDYVGRGIVLTDRYYTQALDRLEIRDCEVTVVCEDINYLSHFSTLLGERGCFVHLSEPITSNPNVDDFWHLASSRRQVLANSSYCWWAAAVAKVAMTETSAVYPVPWLPNSWSAGAVPDLGLPGWSSVPAEFE